MKKAIFFLFFQILLLADVKSDVNFSLYKETEHFQVFCEPQDQEASDVLLTNAEANFEKFSNDFQVFYTDKFKIMVYPNIQSFHEEIGMPDAPDWEVESDGDQTIKIVSPNEPGRVHNFKSIIRCGMAGLAELFIFEKYPKCEENRWLIVGAAFHESHFYIRPVVKEWLCDLKAKNAAIPSVIQMEQNENNFDVDSYRANYALVEFIKEKWGWESVLKLLEDYSAFENIFGVSKEEFRDQWIVFLHEKYPDCF
ncbi:MAG: hypothetical protein HZB76_01165 [Chlamydiae bacterium]|nr:hypothetical protein [Chlamydiota bacterium]